MVHRYKSTTGLVVTLLAVMAARALAQTPSPPTVAAPQGPLIGARSADAEIRIFRGIPYAVPPVGERRWKAAEPAPDWRNPRLATQYSPTCTQVRQPSSIPLPDGTSHRPLFWQPEQQSSEDCLYLNVWAAERDPEHPGEPLPVMVWIHGGAFMNGSGVWPQYDGEALARKGVIVATINYRLGIFGFFSHPELTQQANGALAANFALSDQIQALQWVRRNIGAFGGDPDNVTIFGESAGSFSVSLLLATKLSEGLFQKAIGQSGAYFRTMPKLNAPSAGLRSAEEIGREFANRAAPGKGLAGLRALSAEELAYKAETLGGINPAYFATIDGAMFSESVFETFAAGRQRSVPVLIGFDADEGSGLADYGAVSAPPATPQDYEAEVRRRFGDLADKWLKLYPSTDPVAATFNAFRDSAFGWGMQNWADSMRRVDAPAYLYYFSRTSPMAHMMRPLPNARAVRKLGAFHGSEIPYVFGRAGKSGGGLAPQSIPDSQLSDTISDYWVAFARTGNPNGGRRPQWLPYTPRRRNFLEFGDTVSPGRNLLPGSLELHSEIYRRRTRAGLSTGSGPYGLALTPPAAEE
jgi:para-nitrobenzyl esterase